MPDSPTPPNGVRKSRRYQQFTQVIPTFIFCATRCPRVRFVVQIDAANPYFVSFAIATASSPISMAGYCTPGRKFLLSCSVLTHAAQYRSSAARRIRYREHLQSEEHPRQPPRPPLLPVPGGSKKPLCRDAGRRLAAQCRYLHPSVTRDEGFPPCASRPRHPDRRSYVPHRHARRTGKLVPYLEIWRHSARLSPGQTRNQRTRLQHSCPRVQTRLASPRRQPSS